MQAVGNLQIYCFALGAFTHPDPVAQFSPSLPPPLSPHVHEEIYSPFKFPLELLDLSQK